MSWKDTITKTILAFAVVSLTRASTVYAVGGSYEEAMEIRQLLTVKTAYLRDLDPVEIKNRGGGETILLPVSRGFSQRGTSLCWAYATLNALETVYLVRNPEGLDVELSRRAMQYYTMEDRYRRSIKNVNTYISEAGVVLDAIRLIQSNGIVSFEDYNDITDPYGQANISDMIDSGESFTDKIVAMHEGMNIVYKTPPTLTLIPSNPTLDAPDPTYVEAGAGDLAKVVLAGEVWQSYTPSETEVGFHDHPDPDSRWENMSWYMPRSEFPSRINQALGAGFPVIVSIRNHGVLLYGADYDSSGSPVKYYIKDSYDTVRLVDGQIYFGYFYEADADYLHEILWEMTTVKL